MFTSAVEIHRVVTPTLTPNPREARTPVYTYREEMNSDPSGRDRTVYGQRVARMKEFWTQGGHSSTSSSGAPTANQDAALFTRRQDTPDRTRDDSSVFTESKTKGSASRRPKRRGESFSLRSNSAVTRTSSWRQSESDSGARDSVQYAGSVSSEHTDRGAESAQYSERVRRMYSTKSTPSLQQYAGDTMEQTAPPGVVPSQSWHSSMASVSSSHRGDSDHQSRMKKSSSYSHAPSTGAWDNPAPRPYNPSASTVDNKENRPGRGHSEQDIRHGYSASFSGSSSVSDWQRAHSTSQLRNYENYDNLRYGDSVSTGDSYRSDGSVSNVSKLSGSYRSVSPPMPPVRDASSLRYIKVSQSHEKYPSWPVTQATAPATGSEPNLSSERGINSRTNSWSDTTHTHSEFPNKPRMAYQPQLNTHTEERMSPRTMKKYLQENRIQSPQDRFNERVENELISKGVDVDIKKDFPLDAKGKLDMSHMTGSNPSYPLPQLDKDGRYKEDKNYAIPSPPQRDNSPVHHDHHGSTPNIVHSKEFPGHNFPRSTPDYSYNGQQGRSSPPLPLPDNSVRQTTASSRPLDSVVQSANSSHNSSNNASPQQNSNYPYVVRNIACYNTSTQTDSKTVEVQTTLEKSKTQMRREEKSVQARPGSIVSHQQQHLQQARHAKDNDYERLIFHREGEQSQSDVGSSSVSVGTDMATSPGPLSPREHRLVNHMEQNHRIPETISENDESRKPAEQVRYSDSKEPKTLKDDLLAQISEHSEDDTVMLRRLSQDFFRGQGQYGVNKTPVSSESNLSQSLRGIPESEVIPANQGPIHQRSKSHSHLKQEDTISDLPKMPAKDQSQYFNRNKSANMSLRKAYGIFEEVDSVGKFPRKGAEPPRKVSQGDTKEKTTDPNRVTPPKKSGKKKKKSPEGAVRESKVIAEKARRELEQSGKFDPSEGRLRRTTSEQIRPMKERVKESTKHPERKSSDETSKRSKSAQQEHRRKSSEPPSIRDTMATPLIIHNKQASASDVQKVEDFLCNSPLSRQRRMPSDPDSMPPVSHVRHHSSNRSSSSTDEHSRNSDPELKKFQQQALLGFYEKKSGRNKRLSSGSGEASQNDTTQSPLASPLGQGPIHAKSVSLPREMVPPYGQETRRSAPSQESPSVTSESKHGPAVDVEEDIPSPPLLDTTKELSPAKAGNNTSFSFKTEYSPPPHPWPEAEYKNRSWSFGSHSQDKGSPTRKTSHRTEQVPLSQTKSHSADETHPKALEAMESAASSSQHSPGLASESSEKYAYQITVNKNYSAEEDEEERPPVLPPRSYRSGDKLKSRPSPREPLEPGQHERKSSDGWEPESNNNLQKNVSQVNVRFNSDYNATPKVDSYADQLRQQSRRISQSQSSLLSAARYQNKPLPETKTSISSSRPVEKPPSAQEARVPAVRPSDVSHDWSASERSVLDNVRATTGPISPRGLHSATNSFDSSVSAPSPRQSLQSPSASSQMDASLPSPSFDSRHSSASNLPSPKTAVLSPKTAGPSVSPRVVQEQSIEPRTASEPKKSSVSVPVTWEQNVQQNNQTRLQSHLQEFVDAPPPPYPPKNISPLDHRHDNKPLPSPPKDLSVEANGDDTPTSARYSADSYLFNRGTTRQGFGGNYHRSSGESSPSKSTGVSPVLPPHRHEPQEPDPQDDDMKHIFTSNKMADQNMAIPLRNLNKPYMDPPWGAKRFYPAAGKQEDVSAEGKQNTNATSPSAGQNVSPQSHPSAAPSGESSVEHVPSPSVKACIANFESWSPRTQRKFGQSVPPPKEKISELGEMFLKRSNENLFKSGKSDLSRDRDSSSSRSRSNESLDDKSPVSKSTENLNKSSISPSARDKIIPPIVPQPMTSPDTMLPLTLDTKPTSPTLESGYNSHTPDNRSIISELSLSSGASNQSRQGSTVSKESVDIPTSHSVTVVHVRQKSIEEIECDQQAALLVSKLPEKEKQQLSEVILPPPQHKTSTDYMSGLFDTRVDASRKPSVPSKESQPVELFVKEESTSGSELDLTVSSAYWSPPSIAQLQNKMRQNHQNMQDLLNEGSNATLDSQKTELVARIEKKLAILRDDRKALEEEMEENNSVGEQVTQTVEQKAKSFQDFNKFKMYLDELDTVLKLLLKVSGQLARAENALMSLPNNADSNEKKLLKAKRDDLSEKHEDARQLKEGIDLRSQQVAALLRRTLTEEEFNDYEYFIKMKSKLKLEQREIEDKISLGEEQLSALKKSLSNSS